MSLVAKLYLTMNTPATTCEAAAAGCRIPLSYQAQHWYAAYTCPRHEKWVAKQLHERELETFVPLYRSLRQWKDRRKTVELALFPCYVFVRICPTERLKVLQTPGVVQLVSFHGLPAPLPEVEIEGLRKGLNEHMCLEPCAYLQAGNRVRVVRGPLTGATGILNQFKGKLRIVITLEVLMRSVAVEIEAHDVEALR